MVPLRLHAVLLAVFLVGFLRAQTKTPSHEPQAVQFSKCQVTLTGTFRYSATISKGVVRDVNGNKWTLPPLVTIPRGGTLTVTATAIAPGAITALPGQISIIETPTAGWISVRNKSAAIPGQATELRCNQAMVRTTNRMFAFEGALGHGCSDDCFQRLIPVYSDGKKDVFVDQHSIDEAVSFRQQGLKNGNFGANLYFVYRDEAARQAAIASICAHHANRTSCSKALEGLKYVFMDVDYFKTSFNGLTSDRKPVPGPVLSVRASVYLSPIDCSAGAESYLSGIQGYPGPESEIIFADHVGIATETYAFVNESNSARWSLLLGDLAPLRTMVGFTAVQISEQQTPLMYQVLLAVGNKIAEGVH